MESTELHLHAPLEHPHLYSQRCCSLKLWEKRGCAKGLNTTLGWKGPTQLTRSCARGQNTNCPLWGCCSCPTSFQPAACDGGHDLWVGSGRPQGLLRWRCLLACTCLGGQCCPRSGPFSVALTPGKMATVLPAENRSLTAPRSRSLPLAPVFKYPLNG